MENPVLQNSVEVEKRSKKKLLLAISSAIIILLIGLLLIVVFINSKPIEKTPEPTPAPVSVPNIAIGEPNPNTPIPVESELTYTFPEAYGFEITYTAADWTVATEPSQVNDYNPSSFAPNANVLTLQSTIDPEAKIQIFFTSAQSGMLNGNPSQVCNSVYQIVKEVSSAGANDGLIRLDQGDSGTLIYSNDYHPGNGNELCVFNSHPIYKVEKVAGGENPHVPDTNDIYWIATVYTKRGNSQLDKIDEIVKTIKFAD